jgi:hypothetical protein
MRPSSDPPRDLADRVIRQALRHPDNLRAFLRQVVPTLADNFDCERRRLLDREFPLEGWRRREADLPFEIPYRLGDGERSALVYVLLEHQSAEDPAMPLRLLVFTALYWERQWKAWTESPAPKDALELSPVLPLVLYTGEGAWQNNRTLHDLLAEPAEFHGFVPQWGPLFWELGQHSADELLDSGDAWQQVLAVLRAQGEPRPEDFERVFVEAMRRTEDLANRDHVRWCDLINIMLSWARARRPRQERDALQAAAEAAVTDANRKKEVRIMGKTIAEAEYEEGRLKGLSEGETKGALATRRADLRDLLTDRFGPLPESVNQAIDSVTDVNRLATAFRKALRLENLADLEL